MSNNIKRRKQEGSLTVEASLVLVFFVHVIMLFLNFGQVYRAQNYVSHAFKQTGQAISQDYYILDKAVEGTALGSLGGSIYELVSAVVDTKPLNEVILYFKLNLLWSDVKQNIDETVFKKYMKTIIGDNLEMTLKSMGIQEGLDSFSFEKMEMNDSDGDVFVCVKYKVKLPFPFLGYDEMELKQKVRTHIWKVE